jgi:cytochrome c biogenesis protein CcmG/thiol:disulfide interchange protein DsbE
MPQPVIEKWLTPPPDTAGKFILIDFWATWCDPCRASIPALNQIQARHKDKLVVIGLSGEPEQIVRRMTSPKIDYSLAIDTQRRLASAIGVQAIPLALIIDPKGIVRYHGHPGYLTEKGLETLFARYAN